MPVREKLKAFAIAIGIMILFFVVAFQAPPRQSDIGNQASRAIDPTPSENEKVRRYRKAFEFPSNPRVSNLKWTASVESAVEKSRQSGKRIFLAIDSANSVYAAQNRALFAQNEKVQQHLQKYVLLALFIDAFPDVVFATPTSGEWKRREIESNRKIRRETFGTVDAPNYAIVEPTKSGSLRLIERSPIRRKLSRDPERLIHFLQSHSGKKD